MQVLLTLLHISGALFLVAVVLLQTGKRADLAGAFGGGGSQTAFGTRGAATLLTKLTTAAAVLFMFTSLGLSILASRDAGRSATVLEEVEQPESTAPDLPALPAAPESSEEQPQDELPPGNEP